MHMAAVQRSSFGAQGAQALAAQRQAQEEEAQWPNGPMQCAMAQRPDGPPEAAPCRSGRVTRTSPSVLL